MHSVTSNAVYTFLGGYKVKNKTVKGTTNANGILYKDNSGGTIIGTERIINAKVTTRNDTIARVGTNLSLGQWLQMLDYNNNKLANTYFEVSIIYTE